MTASEQRGADAIVLGAGVIGLLLARALRQTGREVLLLERGQPGQQASWASAGIVADLFPSQHDPLARLRHPSLAAYRQLAAELREEVGLDVELRLDGVVVVAFGERQAAELADDVARERATGQQTEYLEGAALREAEPGLAEQIFAGRLAPGGNLEPRRLCRALEVANRRAGVRIVTGCAALEVLAEGGRVAGVRTIDGDYAAPLVVNCLGAWAARLVGGEPPLPVVPQRGQILALLPPEQPIRRVLLTEDDPYLVPRADGRLVVGATRELVGYDPSLTAEGVAWLLGSAVGMLPSLRGAPIHEMWSGFRPFSLDGRPLIGQAAPDGLYVATGHGPSGITQAPGTVELLCALIEGRPCPIPAEPFSPFRTHAASGRSARPIPGHP